METYYNVRNGCSKWSDCFTCPFEDCQIGRKGKKTNGGSVVRKERYDKVSSLDKKGYNTEQIARMVGISERTVQRIKSLAT